MSNEMDSFGRRALHASSVAELLALERQDGKSERFALLDSLTGEILIRALCGERIVTMKENEVYENAVTIDDLNSQHREFLSETFSLEHQHSKGAWFVPDKVSLSGGIANFPSYLTKGLRFPHGLASLERGKVLLKSSADAIFLWAVLAPMFERLLSPFELRGRLLGTLSDEEEIEAWREAYSFFDGLGFSNVIEMDLLRRQWRDSRDASSQLRAKQTLLRALSNSADASIGTRYRVSALVPLLTQYYKKAKADGRVKRKQALTKPFQATLSGFFQGDWLAFLDYVGEAPHPDEQIVTAIPKTPLKVRGISRAEEIAASQGIPKEEVQRIAAALWQESAGTSPVEARIEALKKFWEVFDSVHSKQQTGMKPLWGLIEEVGSIAFERNAESPYQPGLYRELVPGQLIGEIESLWGTIMITKWPDRIVTEPFPHQTMAETFGPALRFWQSCALTAWFICEGPYSRTDMAGLAHHERRELHELKEMGMPIDESLFKDLIKGESRLGPEEPITRDSSTTAVGHGFSITMSVSAGSRRKGFEILRDIITRHRRAWTNLYLDSYLRTRWEAELDSAAKAFNLLINERGGKAPTLKQFAKSAQLATNHWFNGDVTGLYRAIGEKAPIQPTRIRLMPEDMADFVRRVYDDLPSNQFQVYEGRISDDTSQDYYRKELAELAIKYVQLEEALGRPLEMKELGDKFTYRSKVLNADEATAWRIYSDAVQKAKADSPKRTKVQPNQSSLVSSIQAEIPSSSGPAEKPSNQPEAKRSWLDRVLGRR
jgi:hypothetical protein